MRINKFTSVVTETVRVYIDHHIAQASAALSYFLMLSIFPMLICLYEMLGSMFPTPADIAAFVSGILPSETVDTIVDYLSYVMQNHSMSMLTMALIAMATTSAAAFRTIDRVMGEIRGKRRFTGFFALVFSFLFSLIFLAGIYFAVVIVLTGNWFTTFVEEKVKFIHVSDMWNWFRFILLFLLLLMLNLGIYRITAPKGNDVRIFTGAVLSSTALVGVSILFSYFIGMSVKYPLVYGSLASVMILLLWLYICGNIVLLGNIVNVALEKYT